MSLTHSQTHQAVIQTAPLTVQPSRSSPLQRDFKERIQQQKSTQNRLKEQRQQIARAKKYHGDYHVQLRARMMRARTKEERVS